MEASTLNIHGSLIEKCRNSDVSAQYELYSLYSKAMFNTALRMVQNQNDAEDILQESFISAFQHISSYREDSSFGAWIKRIVINKALNHIKKEKRDIEFAESYATEPDEVSEPVHEPEKYSVDAIRTVLKELPSGFRTVISLYLFEGYDHKEISEILEISESTSKSQYKRGKEKLKELIIKRQQNE